MMGVKLTFRDREFTAALQQATADGLLAASTLLQTKCKIALNQSAGPTRVAVKRRVPGGNRSSRTVYRSVSSPGEAPRKRTGFLQRNVLMEFDRTVPAGRVGVGRNAMYGLYLELGTRRMAPRPWLVRTLMENRAILGRLAVSTGGKRLRRAK
jgi:hypothetical protein